MDWDKFFSGDFDILAIDQDAGRPDNTKKISSNYEEEDEEEDIEEDDEDDLMMHVDSHSSKTERRKQRRKSRKKSLLDIDAMDDNEEEDQDQDQDDQHEEKVDKNNTVKREVKLTTIAERRAPYLATKRQLVSIEKRVSEAIGKYEQASQNVLLNLVEVDSGSAVPIVYRNHSEMMAANKVRIDTFLQRQDVNRRRQQNELHDASRTLNKMLNVLKRELEKTKSDARTAKDARLVEEEHLIEDTLIRADQIIRLDLRLMECDQERSNMKLAESMEGIKKHLLVLKELKADIGKRSQQKASEKSVKHLESKAKEQYQEILRLRNQCEDAESKLRLKRDSENELRDKLVAKELEIERLLKLNGELQVSFELKKREVLAGSTTSNSAEKIVEQINNLNKQGETETTSKTTTLIESKPATTVGHSTEAKILAGELEVAQKEIGQLMNQVSSKNTEIEDLHSRIKQLNFVLKENGIIEGDGSDDQGFSNKLLETVEKKYKSDLANLEKKNASLERELKSRRVDLDIAREKVETIKTKHLEMVEICSRLLERENNLETEMDELRRKLKAALEENKRKNMARIVSSPQPPSSPIKKKKTSAEKGRSKDDEALINGLKNQVSALQDKLKEQQISAQKILTTELDAQKELLAAEFEQRLNENIAETRATLLLQQEAQTGEIVDEVEHIDAIVKDVMNSMIMEILSSADHENRESMKVQLTNAGGQVHELEDLLKAQIEAFQKQKMSFEREKQALESKFHAELESERATFEMEREMGSRQLETRVAQLEEQLTESNEKVSQLQKVNSQLQYVQTQLKEDYERSKSMLLEATVSQSKKKRKSTMKSINKSPTVSSSPSPGLGATRKDEGLEADLKVATFKISKLQDALKHSHSERMSLRIELDDLKKQKSMHKVCEEVEFEFQEGDQAVHQEEVAAEENEKEEPELDEKNEPMEEKVAAEQSESPSMVIVQAVEDEGTIERLQQRIAELEHLLLTLPKSNMASQHHRRFMNTKHQAYRGDDDDGLFVRQYYVRPEKSYENNFRGAHHLLCKLTRETLSNQACDNWEMMTRQLLMLDRLRNIPMYVMEVVPLLESWLDRMFSIWKYKRDMFQAKLESIESAMESTIRHCTEAAINLKGTEIGNKQVPNALRIDPQKVMLNFMFNASGERHILPITNESGRPTSPKQQVHYGLTPSQIERVIAVTKFVPDNFGALTVDAKRQIVADIVEFVMKTRQRPQSSRRGYAKFDEIVSKVQSEEEEQNRSIQALGRRPHSSHVPSRRKNEEKGKPVDPPGLVTINVPQRPSSDHKRFRTRQYQAYQRSIQQIQQMQQAEQEQPQHLKKPPHHHFDIRFQQPQQKRAVNHL